MIQESFIFLDRISSKTERNIWNHASNWDSFQARQKMPGFSDVRKSFYDRRLKEAEAALKQQNARYFAEKMPLSETWRLYEQFKDDIVLLDIETDFHYGNITVIGVSDCTNFKALVRGFNLDRENLLEALKDKKLIITFNGASFDLPIIERYFHMKLPPIPHIDLRHVCKKAGFVGGLKSIEHQLGITRPEEAFGVTGMDAVWLWQKFQMEKSPEALEKLIAYNQADVENMKIVADKVIPVVWGRTKEGSNF